jgi:hypothetical protein
MTLRARPWIVAALAFGLTAPAAADAPPTPTRHLVYDFTYGSSSDLTVEDAGIASTGGQMTAGASASGISDDRSGQADQGTITVDVMQIQPDTGLVVDVSEQAQTYRTAVVAECIVYGNTNVVCDPEKKVNDEELLVLRLLGRNFVDPAQVDDKNHWRVAHSDTDGIMTDDFTIAKNVNGAMQIASERVFKRLGAQIVTTTSDTKIDYDFNRTVPTSISEEAITREQRGMSAYNTTIVQTTMTLQQDSLTRT